MMGKPFIPDWAQLRPFVAELWLIATIVAVLISAFWARKSNVITGLVTLAGLVAALIALLAVGSSAPGQQFAGMLVTDSVAFLWKVMLLVFAAGVVVMWFSTTAAAMHEGDGPEFFTLLLGATIGMCLMASTTNLLMIFMAVELASLPSYVLAGFRKTDRLGSEAALKYVLFGAATSSLMVYGMSWLYGLYGTLQVEVLARQLAAEGAGIPVIIALVGIIAGIGFKISAVPFHFWCPDVFEGAGVDVAAFLSVASKGAGLTLLMRIVMSLAASVQYGQSDVLLGLAIVLGVLGALTATVGNTAAFVQTNIKRLLAYSSIAHAGYMLCALSLLMKSSAEGADPATATAGAILVYLAVYLFMNLGAFTVAGLIQRQTRSESIDDYAGLGRRSPLLALCMAAFMFSLVGLPPFAGFAAKFNVMLILAHGWWWALVVVIGVNTIASLYYYMRVVRMMYLVDSDKPALSPNPLGVALSSACAVMLLAMLVAFAPLYRMVSGYGKLHVAGPAPVVKADARQAIAARQE